MSTVSTKTLILAVVGPAPLRTTVLAGTNYTRQHANLLVPGQIVSDLVNKSYNKCTCFYFCLWAKCFFLDTNVCGQSKDLRNQLGLVRGYIDEWALARDYTHLADKDK
jgi:hypothetical protein